MDKLEMKTARISQENIEKIRGLFPNAVTEVIKDGKVELAVDFDVLKQELSDSLIEAGQERYQMTWPDKKKSVLLANSAISATLRPCKEESVDFDTTQNLYIEGDNLDVLKLLRETYLGKVKMIYIDPPYNTGNDFVYEDDFSQSAEEYAGRSGQYDEQGKRLFQNTESNGRFHTDWLNMIYPRLKVARDLLSDDGVIFISIDDNEQANLKKICDEVFGESNFVNPFIWLLPRGINAGIISRAHEYVLCYAKNFNNLDYFKSIDENSISIERCNKKVDERHPLSEIQFPAGIRYEGPDKIITEKIEGSEEVYIKGKLVFKDGHLAYPVTLVAGWTMKNMILAWLEGKKVYDLKGQKIEEFFFKENGKLYSKKRVNTASVKSVLSNMPDTQKARKELEQLFGTQDLFSYPKTIWLPLTFQKFVTEKDSIILDFFSGSATTAHAVMQLNAEDGGNRKFIMVQLPEKCDEKSEAYKAGYKTICEIGKERIRRAGKKIKEELEQLNKLYNSTVSSAIGSKINDKMINSVGELEIKDIVRKDFELVDENRENKELQTMSPQAEKDKYKFNPDLLDTGFRVLKLDSSNMQDVFYNPAAMTQDLLSTTIDNVKPDRTPMDLLFQIMLELGVQLSAKIEEKEICGKKYYVVNENEIIACFDDNLNNDVITEIAKQQPLYAVFKDKSFATDSVGINNEQLFKTYSPSTEVKVI